MALFIYMFCLVILIIALLKWNLSNLEIIKDLKKENQDLKKSNDELLKANFELIKKNRK